VDVERHRKVAVARAVEGEGKASLEARRAAFAGEGPESIRALIEKVAQHAYKVTDEDLAAAKQHFSEDEIYELVVCAAYGRAERIHAAALAAIAEVG
jgi:alkylhydroperoxidase family enzyme